ncbi:MULTISPECIES: VolA/Pla-1 family phospholipase [Pseudidiomarina]|uniref:Pla-1/cef family extracellular lipase n=2 Tax=Pseudidiomarina TaxID=2800384 RepID=A0A368V697_9GAMM|nr:MULTISPECIES: VolA/Pla-1 family phospholipase [Pseudidiomarina]PWW16135.1 Pla-1/cef family extracellular lipase [Pseudidiomarina maritima]RBP93355.1 Pla-1/cef family extracellular lipase [Pseudidiomarina tainanensis]RCW35815.1 Pla-1/cef family extracellular lipase [Pseudidiomarina tainanensis]
MKKLLLVTAIGSALSLVGCGGGDDAPESVVTEYQVAATRAVFDPSNGQVPVPSNILLSGTVDGTLNIPVADPTDGGNPQVAINGLDGWGTHSTLTFSFSLPKDANGNDVTVDTSSLEAPGAVRMFEAVMGGTAVNETCAAANPAATCAVAAELTYGVDYIVRATGPAGVAVIPLKPWKPKTGYLAILTDNITDSLGRSVKPSQTYGLMKRNVETDPVSGDASALSLQGLINSHENALAAAGVDKDSIIYASSFTTQSTDDAFHMVKTMMAAQFAQSAQVGLPSPNILGAPLGVSVADFLVSNGMLEPDPTSLAYLAATAANMYQAQVSLPYFSPLPTAENPQAPLQGRWQAKCDSGVSVLGAIQAGAIDPMNTPSINPAWLAGGASTFIPAWVQQCLLATDPAVIASMDFPGVDTERHVTKYNPVPAVQGNQTIGAIVTVPNPAAAAPVRAALGLGELTMPEGGWPVVIFQHGITADKGSALGIAGTLAVAGFATVAIDHPLHGDRGFGPINATSGKGPATAYMNLGSLLTTRDNLRQSISDMLGLRLSLNANNLGIDGTNAYFVGHSLGAITGTPFTALANSPLSGDLAPYSSWFEVQGSSLMAPGASIANFLLGSPSFGPVIKSQLLYSQSPDFAAAVNAAAEGAGIAPTDPQFQGLLIQVYNGFWGQLSAAEQAEINGVFEQFAFAAQTVVDSADPINYAAAVRATESPIHLIEVVGNGSDVLPDQVVPNTVAGKPLAGTEALISALQLATITETTVGADGSSVSGAVRFTAGDHGSIVSPAASAEATLEMQTQAAFWFANGTSVLPISDPSVIKQ